MKEESHFNCVPNQAECPKTKIIDLPPSLPPWRGKQRLKDAIFLNFLSSSLRGKIAFSDNLVDWEQG